MGQRGDESQVVYVDGDIPQLPLQLGQLLVDSSLISPGTTNLQQCTSQSPLIYEPIQSGYPATPAGAVPDGNGSGGGTNNAAALQAWLDAHPGELVMLPAGIYRCDIGLTVPADTFILMEGATIDFTNTSNEKGLIFTDGGGTSGGKVTGPTSGFNAGQMGISCQGTNNAPAAPTYVTGPDIEGTEIANWGQYGCYWAYCNAPTMDHAWIHDIGYAGSGGVSCNDGTLTNSLVEDIGPGTDDDAYGVFWDRLEGTETADPRSYRCGGFGNRFRNIISGTGTNGQAMDSHAGVDITYAYNFVDNCNVGCAFVGSDVNGVPTLAPIRCQEYGNTYNLASSEGYGVIVAGPYDSGVLQAYAEDCVVGPSIMEGGGIAGDASVGAYHLQATKNCTVKIGTIKNPRCNGVLLLLDNIGFNVSGGAILDPYDDAVTTAACVAVRGNNNQGYIGGTTFQYSNAALGTYVAVHSIRVSAGLTGLSIDLGRCSFVGIDASHLSYSADTATGMNPSGLYGETNRATFTLTSGNASTTQSVSFGKRFPHASARISLQVAGAIAPGGKTNALRTSNVTATGFDIIAYPTDLTTWSATAALDVDWSAAT